MYLLELRLRLCGRAKCFPGQKVFKEILYTKGLHMAGISEGKLKKESFARSLLVVCSTHDLDESHNR